MAKKITVSFEVKHGLTDEDILDILTTGIEGGCSYWAMLDNTHEDWITARNQWKEEHKNDNDPTPCYCDVAYQVMKNGKAVIFYDEEEDPHYKKPLKLTMESFINGCKQYSEFCGKDIHKMIDESEFDASDADCIFQYALLGDIIYG